MTSRLGLPRSKFKVAIDFELAGFVGREYIYVTTVGAKQAKSMASTIFREYEYGVRGGSTDGYARGDMKDGFAQITNMKAEWIK